MTNQPQDPQTTPAEPPTQAPHPTPQQSGLRPYQGYYPPPQVAPKSPGLAVVASFFVPGLGSLVAGRVGMGILIFCLFVLSVILMVVVVGFITAPLVWVWGMIDAYHGARKWNTAHGIIS